MKNPNVIIASDYGPLIVNRNDRFIGTQISEAGYWGIDDIHLIKTLIDVQLQKYNNVTFYDLGANIGTHSVAIGKLYGDKLKIRAFEAQRLIFYMLCGNIAINGLTNAFLHLNAVSDKADQELAVPIPDYGVSNNFGGLELMPPMNNSDEQNVIKCGYETVRTVTIDLFDEKVDFIKMDIEGMEDKALIGAIKTIETHRPIFFIEIIKSDHFFISDFFRARNYSGYQIGEDIVVIPNEYEMVLNGLRRVI